MSDSWDPAAPGVLPLPSGRLIRGRGLGRPMPEGPVPDFGVYLLRDQPPVLDWETRWVPWRDFGLPADRDDARQAIENAWRRCAAERVEVACLGGRGRTGTALACVAILDGVPPGAAVRYVRAHYSPHAVETMWQRRYVRRFSSPLRAIS
jgi:protein-tyrosine phosphatase